MAFAIMCLFGGAQYHMSKRWQAPRRNRFWPGLGYRPRRSWTGCWRTTGLAAQAADQAAQQVRLVREGLSDRQARRENSRRGLFDFVHAFAPEVTDLFGCSAALSRALSLGERKALAQAKLDGARRLYDALKAQGGQELDGQPPRPACSGGHPWRRPPPSWAPPRPSWSAPAGR